VSPYVGFNWQFAPQWLGGLEADLGLARQTATIFGNYEVGAAVFGSTRSLGDSFAVKTGWDGSVRARLGFLPTPQVLLYVTGGVAWMQVEATSTCDTSPARFSQTAPGFISAQFGPCTPNLLAPAVITQSRVKTGATIGAGTEARLWSNWIARAEYRYADFGKVDFTDTRSCAGSASSGPTPFGTFSVNCGGLVNSATNSLWVRTHSAMFGIAYKFD
jgi:outer membrane immunogenic protein